MCWRACAPPATRSSRSTPPRCAPPPSRQSKQEVAAIRAALSKVPGASAHLAIPVMARLLHDSAEHLEKWYPASGITGNVLRASLSIEALVHGVRTAVERAREANARVAPLSAQCVVDALCDVAVRMACTKQPHMRLADVRKMFRARVRTLGCDSDIEILVKEALYASPLRIGSMQDDDGLVAFSHASFG